MIASCRVPVVTPCQGTGSDCMPLLVLGAGAGRDTDLSNLV